VVSAWSKGTVPEPSVSYWFDDLTRFCQMIIAGGGFNGKRLLSEAAVKQATSVETGDIKINGNDVMDYGFGWSVLKKAPGDGRSAGSFGHGGAYKTAMWIDPPKDRIFILLRHQSGETLTPEGKSIEAVFYKSAIASFNN
jgi:CubicO group peptidase (beta-lactamase class C family)